MSRFGGIFILIEKLPKLHKGTKYLISHTLIQNNSIQSIVKGVIQAALDGINPIHTTRNSIHRDGNNLWIKDRCIQLGKKHLFVLGIGKASVTMANGLYPYIEDVNFKGLLITKQFDKSQVENLSNRFQIAIGDHPIPGKNSFAAGNKVKQFLMKIEPNDYLILLISGGASSLVIAPVNGIELSDIQIITKLLLDSGAPIADMNCIRKHIDELKGGGIANLIFGAEITSLVLSDVLNNEMDVIASGPVVGDKTTFSDAMRILEKYQLIQNSPISVINWLRTGINEKKLETLKPGNPVLKKCKSYIIGSNRLALEASANYLSRNGIRSIIISSRLEGDAFIRGKQLAALGNAINPLLKENWCLISGGETTVAVSGKGKGGRNLEMALGAVQQLATQPNNYFMTFASDGEDGPTDAAGALVFPDTYQIGIEMGLSPEGAHMENDSYHYFQKTTGLIKTGSTGTNANDLAFLFHFSK